MPYLSSLSPTAPVVAEVVSSLDSSSGHTLRLTMKAAGPSAVSNDTSHFLISIQDAGFTKPEKSFQISAAQLKAHFNDPENANSSLYEHNLEITDLSLEREGSAYAASIREHLVDNSQGPLISMSTFTKSGQPSAPVVSLLEKGVVAEGAGVNLGKFATVGIKLKVSVDGPNGGTALKRVYSKTTHQSAPGVYTSVDQPSMLLTEDDLATGYVVYNVDVPHSVKDSNHSTVVYVENVSGIDSEASDRILGNNDLRVAFALVSPVVSASTNSTSGVTVKLAPKFHEDNVAVKLSILARVAGGRANASYSSTDLMNAMAPTGDQLNKELEYEVKKVSNADGSAMVDLEPNTAYEFAAVLCGAAHSIPTISSNIPLYKLGVVSQSKNSNAVKGLKRASIAAINASLLNTNNLVVTKVADGDKYAGSLILSEIGYTPSMVPAGQSQLWTISSIVNDNKKKISRSLSSFETTPSSADLATLKALMVPASEMAKGATYELAVAEVLPFSATALAELPELKTQEGVHLHNGTHWVQLSNPKTVTFKDAISGSDIGKPNFVSLNAVKNLSSRNLLLKIDHSDMPEGLKINSLNIEVADSEAFDTSDAVFISTNPSGPAVKSLVVPVINGDAPEFLNVHLFPTLGSIVPVDLVNGKTYHVRVRYSAIQSGFTASKLSDDAATAYLTPLTSDDGALPAVAALTATPNVANKNITGSFVIPTAAGHTYLGATVRLHGDRITPGSELASQKLGATANKFSFGVASPQSSNYTVVVTPLFRKLSTLEEKAGSDNFANAKFPGQFKIVSLKVTKAPHGSNDVVNGQDIDGKSALKVTVKMADESVDNVEAIFVTIPHSVGNSLTLSRVGLTPEWEATFNSRPSIQYASFTPVVLAVATSVSGAGYDIQPRQKA